jgi:putative iron-dependent peroxidase
LGGSYVIVQKYLHDLNAWDALPVEMQEQIIGRPKLSDVELSDADKPAHVHNALTNIEENGRQLQILLDNMPFGRAFPQPTRVAQYFDGDPNQPKLGGTLNLNSQETLWSSRWAPPPAPKSGQPRCLHPGNRPVG